MDSFPPLPLQVYAELFATIDELLGQGKAPGVDGIWEGWSGRIRGDALQQAFDGNQVRCAASAGAGGCPCCRMEPCVGGQGGGGCRWRAATLGLCCS